MTPRMRLWQRVVAWAMWRLNGWKDPEGCKRECLLIPETSRVVGLMRGYWYVRKARDAERGK